MQGTTASGAPYYKADGVSYWLYWDPDCGGNGGTARWILDTDVPSTTAASHLDGDGFCNDEADINSDDSSSPKMGVLSEDVKDSDLLSDELQAAYTFDAAVLSVALICTLLASVIVASVLAVYQVYQSTRSAARSAAVEREASIARGRLTHPPTHDWELCKGNRYCMFLSHFKVEAGSDARYLSDLIKRKTGCAAYLDSNDLVDMRTLFNEGELTITLTHVL